MDNGELFKRPFQVTPYKSGGFSVGWYDRQVDRNELIAAFTNLNDLMRFLQQQANPLMTVPGGWTVCTGTASGIENYGAGVTKTAMTASEINGGTKG